MFCDGQPRSDAADDREQRVWIHAVGGPRILRHCAPTCDPESLTHQGVGNAKKRNEDCGPARVELLRLAEAERGESRLRVMNLLAVFPSRFITTAKMCTVG